MGLVETIRAWASRIERDALTLWFARAHPATPWYAKALGALVVAYALSPIDLIPDFVPVLGFLDEVILLPGLIWLTIRLLPEAVLDESRQQAGRWLAERGSRPRSVAGAVVIVMIWVLVAMVLLSWIAAHSGL